MLSLFAGLAVTAATGLAMVGAFNPISVAFAVLFVGIGVDFGIQLSVRYRRERHVNNNLNAALAAAAAGIANPLALAAAATAAGFYAFGPTDYRGISELGLVAGTGMIIAFITTITLLPALLTLSKPPGEPKEIGYRRLAPVDRFMARHRIPILLLTGVAVMAGLPLLNDLKFAFNPLSLRSAKVESVATLLELMRDPANTLNGVDVLAPSLQDAEAMARRFDGIARGFPRDDAGQLRPSAPGREVGHHRRCGVSAGSHPRCSRGSSRFQATKRRSRRSRMRRRRFRQPRSKAPTPRWPALPRR